MARKPGEAIELIPAPVEGVDSASASFQSAMGPVDIAWQHSGSALRVQVTIPAGAQAVLHLPSASAWQESGGPATAAAGVLASHPEDAGLELRLGSGHYQFSAAGAAPVAASGR